MATTSGPHLVTQQSEAKRRQAYRRQLRRKLGDLLAAADAAWRAGRDDDFEQLKHAINIVARDLGERSNGTLSPRRVAETLPPSRSATAPRRRGEEL